MNLLRSFNTVMDSVHPWNLSVCGKNSNVRDVRHWYVLQWEYFPQLYINLWICFGSFFFLLFFFTLPLRLRLYFFFLDIEGINCRISSRSDYMKLYHWRTVHNNISSHHRTSACFCSCSLVGYRDNILWRQSACHSSRKSCLWLAFKLPHEPIVRCHVSGIC